MHATTAYIPPNVLPTANRNKSHSQDHLTENNFAPPENINEYKTLTKHTPEFGSKRTGGRHFRMAPLLFSSTLVLFHSNPHRLGPRPDTSDSTLLCVLNIPRDLNTIGKIDEHFSKFGPIVNIEILQNEKKA